MKFFQHSFISSLVAGFLLMVSSASYAAPIQYITDIYGDRTNQLIGYGVVVGLDGTGDKSQVKFTQQSIVNMIKQFGVQLDGGINPKLKNVAAVTVTAVVDSHKGPGQKLNVTVSSIGDAKSLRGGTLLMTQLKGADGNVYALAQGNVVVGGFSAEGNDGSSITHNTPTAGRIPNGATVERALTAENDDDPTVYLQLKKPNYQTALNISKHINQTFGPGVAKALNKGRVEVAAPVDSEDRIMFISMLEQLEIEEGKTIPKVIFNSRSGTVVFSDNVTVSSAAVSQGGITVRIQEDQYVSQPGAAIGGGINAPGRTVVTDDSQINVEEKDGAAMIWPQGTNLQEIVNAINQVGATPTDLMQILQALDEVGAINGELVVI
ncbi:flagellar basal body P-ring protein FlgI [Vibrio algivorus]|uniref:Flagellar P-ring protein n=2 Tax=Vibrio algivorus TaxID=1667024 RepID=A0A557P2R0_9VIBR|nr:flagellar basal body P-ring protein FlgI [Vibrio algivorus]